MTLSGGDHGTTATREDSGVATKSFEISKRLIWEAWKRVAANQGGPGVDRQSIELFRNRLARNLYALWNRMSSGSYFPQPVKEVLIPKGDGFRPLGVPTITDRVAQMAVKLLVEPKIDAIFHSSSFGYRPNKSGKQAVAQARRNCWRYDWVVDIDLKSFFDTIDHELLGRAVEKHVREPWARLYIRRWLESPVQKQTGELVARDRGTPQGGVISPLLANLYLHELDVEMRQAGLVMVRYADDAVVLCRTQEEAEAALSRMRAWVDANGLKLHPDKTHVEDCRMEGQGFEFLGYRFEAGERWVRKKSLMGLRDKIRALTRRNRGDSIEGIIASINPILRGWFGYFQNAHRYTFSSVDGFVRRYRISEGRQGRTARISTSGASSRLGERHVLPSP
ncbi:hypothetical protein LMG28614_06246 [Paraburkholderia ultramafica]|uniref:Reverse transcriptase domain-containing protein n=1 Tax=Paraburkholderia ultramafica TaxID=1544867 RepID=A0A6S7BWD3_9BURK|nr:group II intron reverse transcriptase/maturase [Paraburkholderia ultramafica]CAB3805623.1 hypothetical protein LMG28614_06246 [Paraburkholderia ultramafica]